MAHTTVYAGADDLLHKTINMDRKAVMGTDKKGDSDANNQNTGQN